MRYGVKLFKTQSPKIDEENRKMCDIPYASTVGNIQYVVQCIRPDIAFALSATSKYQEWYSDTSFQSDVHDAKSQTGFTFKQNGVVVAWKSSKHDTTTDSTTEAEYIVAFEAAKEVVWMKNYNQELSIAPSIVEPIVIFCDNNGAIVEGVEISLQIEAHS
ncbi:UNVERIFIED_CONTAM: hypothetical protein Slati_1691000 [Sesamum latifolium]|uniref:Uncharacterized protein n=1 Tax=Sesamum latifolium TaxID=2727402 RepID=A0AAW2X0K1_9LAMI